MAIRVSRRDFLAAFGLSFLSSGAFYRLAEAAYKETNLFASAYMDQQKSYGIAILDQDGHILSKYPLPDRGHGIASATISPWLVTFARRPGNFALAIDITKQNKPILFKSPSQTHFYGHGVFSHDGKLLFATENEFENGKGLIGIYDTTDEFTRIGDIPSYGIGPHEIIMMPDGYTLCVANGGILTHPDTGRTKLNLHEMQSSIAFIDSRHGDLITKFDVPRSAQRLSLRHMAVDHRQTVWLGGQYEGSADDEVPLIAAIDDEKGFEFVQLDPVDTHSLAQYIGSVAINNNSHKVAFTSPKGNTILTVDANQKIVKSHKTQQGACGIAPMQKNFMVTSMSEEQKIKNQILYWDNHLIGV